MGFLKFIFFILVLGIAGLCAYQYQKIDQMDTQLSLLRTTLQDSQKAQSDLQKQVADQKTQIASTQGFLQQQTRERQQRLTSLRAQAELEEQRLATLKKSVADLQLQKKNGNQPVLENTIKRDQELLKDIEVRIKSYQTAAKEVNQNSNASLKVRKAQEKAQLEQINDNIKLQNQQIRQTQKDINFWQKKKRDVNQADRLADLDAQLQTQQNNLVQLLNQKKEAADQLNQNAAAIQYESTTQRDEIQGSQAQLQSQALNVRAELQRLLDQKSRGQKDGQSINGQILSLQTQMTETDSKLKSLHDEIHSIENALGHP